MPGAGPGSGLLLFQLKTFEVQEKLPRCGQGAWPFSALCFLEIKIQVFLTPETSGFPRAQPVARETRSGREKHMPAPSCFRSSLGTFTRPDHPSTSATAPTRTSSYRSTSGGRKGRRGHTNALTRPLWHYSHQKSNRGKLKINAQQYTVVLPKRDMSAKGNRGGGNT